MGPYESAMWETIEFARQVLPGLVAQLCDPQLSLDNISARLQWQDWAGIMQEFYKSALERARERQRDKANTKVANQRSRTGQAAPSGGKRSRRINHRDAQACGKAQ
jgi:hypothetical protein